jgi:putative transcriptional regulator
MANQVKKVRKTARSIRFRNKSTGTYRSAAFAAIHEAAEGLHKAGVIDNTTMREFDRDCLTPILRLSPKQIRKIRTEAALSQSVFAAHLNVTTGVVSKWERGEKTPRGPAAKLLSLAAKNGVSAIA